MILFLTMLPIYLFGNFHCLGMCGPLVMMIGRHRFRYLYFLGRMLSYALAGFLAGELGSVINIALKAHHIPALMSFIFGSLLLLLGIFTLNGRSFPGSQYIAKKFSKAGNRLSLLMLQDQPWPSFLFGFFTVILPCGQTLIVFSACALYGDPLIGLLNGFALAFLTSPALILAMQAYHLFQNIGRYYQAIMGCSALIVGALALLRGLAELDLIPHLILNSQAPAHYHLVIY